jgi:hypothetical protein
MRREKAREPRSVRRFGIVYRLRLRCLFRLRNGRGGFVGLGHTEELLLPASLGEALEVPANRVAHVVEVALLAHGR